MAPRHELHFFLQTLTDNVYFQPPPNTQMKYPCILYSRDDVEAAHADNVPYRLTKRYQVTVIDSDPDSSIPDKLAALPFCSFDRHFATDNLNHDVYNLFF
jgi:hypothetical protein